jgi:hypothetical protein
LLCATLRTRDAQHADVRRPGLSDQRGAHREGRQAHGAENASFCPFIYENYHFTKTGSGQT